MTQQRSTTLQPTSLYDRIGGKAALTAVVDAFYARVLADAFLAPLFAGTDMRQQRAHLVAFLAMALGGPTEYRGQGMRQAHAGRGITAEHFGRVAGHLQATLTWANVGAAEVAQIMAAAASLQDDVTGAPR
ncbi:MAG: group I truncated hemoglobin [Planctomycetota bacterium]